MANYSETAEMMMGHIGGAIGAVDSSVNMGVSARSGDGTGTISAAITGIANTASMFPGKAGAVGGSVVILTKSYKNRRKR